MHSPEDIEFIDSIEKALEIILRLADSFTQYLDGCFDSTGPYFIVNSGLVWNKIIQLRKRGIRLRYITEITNENIFSCRKLMTHVEVRHIEGIKGNFGISDGKECHFHLAQNEGEPPTQMILISNRSFVRQQQSMFNALWGRATPAEIKMRQLDESEQDFTETITNHIEAQKRVFELVDSANREILFFYSSSYPVYQEKREREFKNLLRQAAIKRDVKVRILTSVDYNIEGTQANSEMLAEKENQINFQCFKLASQTENTTFLIIDRKFSLAVPSSV